MTDGCEQCLESTSRDLAFSHVEEHPVDVAHVTPVLVGELVVAAIINDELLK